RSTSVATGEVREFMSRAEDSKSEVRAKKPSLTQPGDQRLKGDFRTTNDHAGGL
ncbi:hypothetical protein J6590_104398, partial [Homalodisca vitripennis]